MTGPSPNPPPTTRECLVVVRHGETEWSRLGRHTGTTDVPLTRRGERDAAELAGWLAGWRFDVTLTSPRRRARRTAELAGLPGDVDPDLAEWDYGGYEGLTSGQISAAVSHSWSVWRDGVIAGATPGETVAQVGERVDRVLDRIAPVLAAGGRVALVAHGHSLRVLTARFLGLAPGAGAHFGLRPAGVGVLGFEHGDPVVSGWNACAPGASG